MKYSQGQLGRIFVARFEDEENLLEEITSFAKKEDVREAVFYLLGALREGKCVCGPAESAFPPVPLWRDIKESHEVLGVGTIFKGDGEPLIHLHGALGRDGVSITGCLREEARVYLVVEAVIMEIKGIKAERVFDSASGLKILDFKD